MDGGRHSRAHSCVRTDINAGGEGVMNLRVDATPHRIDAEAAWTRLITYIGVIGVRLPVQYCNIPVISRDTGTVDR